MKIRISYITLLVALSSLLTTRSWATDVVGSPQGQFSVSPTGAATYSVAIDVPPGIGGMQPQIGITYNSQSGMGNVGWGCNITGVSSITRGVKDIFHDGQAKGVSYEVDDTYYLDGKRLVWVSGTKGEAGCLYHPEGEPFTDVTVKGTYTSTNDSRWFEVVTQDGVTRQYGSVQSARQYVTVSGTTYNSAWHLRSATDACGRSISYNYARSNNYTYLQSISYGGTAAASTVTFSYTSPGDAAQTFRQKGVACKMDKLLTAITCKTGSSTFRTYEMSYSNGDGTTVKFPRLSSIRVRGADDSYLAPITLAWNHLPAFSCSNTTEYNFGANYPSGTQITDRMFWSCDMNGDGIDDVVQVATDNKSYEKQSYVSLHQSTRDNHGMIVFLPTNGLPIGQNFSYKGLTWRTSYHFGDMDGDGLNDFLLPCLSTSNGSSSVTIQPFYGTAGLQNTLTGATPYNILLNHATSELPIYAVSDVNNNGICEFLVMEKALSGGYGVLHTVAVSPDRSDSIQTFYFSMPSVPRRLFVADFNGDGMQDMFVLCHSGYKIYWNRGGYTSEAVPSFYLHFSESSTECFTGTDIVNVQDVDLGDFNGDGLPDLLLHGHNSTQYTVAVNQGDGTFSKSQINLNFGDQEINDANLVDKFTMLAADFDYDGKSDLFLAHDYYDYHGGVPSGYEYIRTDVKWYRFTGSTFTLLKSVQTKNENDAAPGHIILGDIDGDGRQELVSYGSDLTTSATYYRTVKSRFYTDSTTTATGKVSSITDGFGNTTQVSYASLASPSVYTKGTGCTYPLADICVPLHVVSSMTAPTVANSSSAASAMTETYTYEGLKAHVAGRGLLGFAKTTVGNDVMGTTTVTETTGWGNNIYYMPTQTTTTTTLNGVGSATTVTDMAIVPKGFGVMKNFFTYPSTVTATDLDGFTTVTTYTYDTNKGVPTLERTIYDGNTSSYKQVAYTYGTAKYGGQWLPTLIGREQRHPDDTQPFSTTQTVTYDAATGLPTQVVDNAHNSSQKLTTAYTYDNHGNITGKTVSGTGLNTVTEKYDYDASGRFVARRYTVPASTVTTYTHDLWGNVLTETDATVASSPLTTTNTYDGFGNLLTSTSPEGIVTAVSRTWGSSPTQKYLVHQTVTGRPWTKTWHDSRGRETRKESVGVKGVTLLTTASYDARGNVTAKTSQTGDITSTSSMTYDGRNRLSSEVLSTGRSTTYTYAGRKVTATTSGRTYEKTYDAWGLLKQSKEPIGTVSYTYKSCGKPSAAGSTGGTVTMAYDNCGNQIRLVDPDAGTTTYAYNAAGDVISQTDARGITTRDSLDLLNRVVQTTTGSTVTTYTYGTSGNAMHRLASQAMDGKTISYDYNQYGRVTSETRGFGSTSYTTSYTYDNSGNLATSTYPGGVLVTYGYDAYGNETSMDVNGSTVWTLTSHTGTATVETLGTGTSALKRSTSRNSHGLLTGITLQKASDNVQLHAMTFQHDAVTGNLTRRTGMIYDGEVFTYDSADRLVRHQDAGSHWDNIFQYATNGNIEYKTGIGSYSYQSYNGTTPCHGVKHVDDSGSLLYTDGCEITYNDFGKASLIDSSHGGIRYDISYGPDQERWQSDHYYSSMQWPDTVRYYVGDMEGYKVGPGDPVWFYHIGHGVILRKVGNGTTTQPTAYYTFTDNLGSVTRIYNSSGTAVFSAEYDPWGVQRQTTNTIGYNRGYCGHEMLNDLQLINMNGRLYDPYIARFLSPDNYVQLPTSAQSFNRYSYCLNNPLKYVDPDGEYFGIDDLIAALVGGSINVIVHVFSGEIHSFGQGAALFGVGALAGWLSEYGGPVTSSIILGGGNSIINQGFENGFDNISFDNVFNSMGMALLTAGLSAQLSGLLLPLVDKIPHLVSPVLDQMLHQGVFSSISGFVWETMASLSNGESFGESLKAGLGGLAEGAVLGMVSGMGEGIRMAHSEKLNPWTGEKRHRHHSYPKFLGGDTNQPLTNISKSRHIELHNEMNDYLKGITNEKGINMRPTRGNKGYFIRKSFTEEMRFNSVKGFYDLHPIKYMDVRWDFYRNNGILKQWKPW